jgi:hypothetical protein
MAFNLMASLDRRRTHRRLSLQNVVYTSSALSKVHKPHAEHPKKGRHRPAPKSASAKQSHLPKWQSLQVPENK